jgi:hypothetical protein
VPSREFFYALVDALEAVPCLLYEDTRSLLVSQLPPAIAGAVRYSAQRRIHAMNIARTCLDYEDGLSDLVAAIRDIEGADSVPLQRLASIVRRLPDELLPEDRPTTP